MKKYKVYFPWYATVKVEVEAASKKKAIEAAAHKVHASVCCHCSRHIDLGEQNTDVEVDVAEIK